MSLTHPTAASSSSSSSSNFQDIINSALDTYEKRTKKDLRAHPLSAQLQACDSSTAILAVLQQQVQGLGRSRSTDERWTKWFDPTVNVLYTFSDILGASTSMVFSPVSVIFAGVGVLLSAAKDVRASHDTLVDIFERIEMFFRRLEIYTEVRPTTEMRNVIIQIMVEVLSILGIATKEIKQGRMKKYVKKLIGRTEIEDALKKLDKLTHEEAWMAIAQNLRATHTVGESVRRVVDDVDQVKRNQLRESIYRWLSPPDPSTNHNIACGTHHKKAASWFLLGSIFRGWKSRGSLLWIHGKPGSGKSVLCSTVTQDIEALCQAGNASMAYFYFDFRDVNKQGLRDLLSSFLIQLSARSGPRCDILSDLFLTHDEGKNQPSDSALAECLKKMLTLPHQRPTYLIIDALDESSNTSGIPSPRDRVLHLLKEFVDLRLPDLHICVTSRPEIDIRDVLEPLTSLRVSLHDQTGQKEDIVDYVKSIVYSNSEPNMKRWRTEDKELVIEVLSKRADGMFRWVFCQLEVLRHCLPPSLRHTLDELPETLDETYEHILKEIKKPNRVHALRLLQCLVVAVRPLRVEELAEVLAVDFGDEGVPKLNPDWRSGDEEQALLASCSSLIAVVKSHRSQIVQFSHFSVKEFLTSDRLCTSSGVISRYHIDLQPAHTVLVQACVSVLLRSDDGVGNNSPLAGYAAEHWVAHAQDQKVSSCIRKAMEYLFDADKPFFTAWIELHDIDTGAPYGSTFYQFTGRTKSGTPLYYAARCGFQDLVEHLVARNPRQVNATGGHYLTPLVVALAAGHFQTANFLYDNGAHPNVGGHEKRTPLHSAAYCGELEMVQILLKYKADVHARDSVDETPLHSASRGFDDGGASKALSLFNVARPMLENDADANAQGDDHWNPLHAAVQYGRIEVIRVLLEHGANINARNYDDTTPLHLAARYGTVKAIHVLLEYGADVNARNLDDTTPLHLAARHGTIGAICVLLEHGADVNARDNAEYTTPLHVAALHGRVGAICVLLEHGADVNARKRDKSSPFHLAAQDGRVEAICVLLKHGADVNARDNYDSTPMHIAARQGAFEAIRVLLEHGADVSARDDDDSTPLHEAAQNGRVETMRVLLKHGADINVRTKGATTPLHVAAQYGRVWAIHVLLTHGADVNARKNDDTTPLHITVLYERVETTRALLENGADVNARDNCDSTPIHVAARQGAFEAIRVLLEHGADINARDEDDSTPLHEAARHGRVESMRVLLKHGANINARTKDATTPLYVSAQYRRVWAIQVLLKHGANVNARKKDNSAPLHITVLYERVETTRALLEHGADVNARDNYNSTPMHVAARHGAFEAIRVLLEHGADVNARDEDDSTPLHEAARNGRVETMRVLLKNGANINVRTKGAITPLHVAARHGRVWAIHVLLKLGAAVNARTNNDTTPLHEAAQNGTVEGTRMLLEHGVNVGAEDGRGRTASQVASERGHSKIMTLLSEYDAS